MRTPQRLGALLLAAASCTSAPGAPSVAVPAPVVAAIPPTLPPIPRVRGPLALRVVYPPEGATIAARDSNFILGSIGNGDATLRVNGQVVRVEPNGAFLAWLPVPRLAPTVYTLTARLGSDSVTRVYAINVAQPRPALSDTGRLVVDSGSAAPRGSRSLRADESVRVSVRAPSNATVVAALANGERVSLVNQWSGGGDRFEWGTDVAAGLLRGASTLIVARGRDSLRLTLDAVSDPDVAGARFALLGAASSAVADTDRVVIARPVPGGTYKWFLLPGTRVQVTGRSADAARVRLDESLEVWVDPAELRLQPAGSPSPRRIASNARVREVEEWADVTIPITERPPHQVEETERGLVVTLYGTRANSDIINLTTRGSIVRRVVWEQVTSDRARYTIELVEPPFGYLVRWERGALVIRVRSAPRIDLGRPLEGVAIAVDAGHPPAGSTGPTGLYEGVATLAISERLRALLESRGARVVMTRIAPGAVALGDRPVTARRAGAHALVSIHLNALPDGVNPFAAHGTGTYYFSPRSELLARAVQRGMLARMGLRDLGINYDNLAVLRPTWMPSILCEGAFLIIPEQESALRSPEFQEAYAQGVLDGIEAYFRRLGAAQRVAR